MNTEIKTLAEAITNVKTKNLVQSHVKQLKFEEGHLTIYVDNAAPLHELEEKEIDHHLQNGMEKVYGDITYELKLFKANGIHEKEKGIGHNIHK